MSHFVQSKITFSLIFGFIAILFGGAFVPANGQEILHDHIPNTILVKFTDEARENLNRETATLDALTSISSVDILNAQFNAVEMRQLIRTDPRFAERHRRYGLDLWFEITFESDADVATLMNAYDADLSIAHVEPKYIYEIYGQQTSPTYTREQVMELFSEFDDPRLNEQWHYNNTGQTGGTPGADIKLFPAWDIETGDSEIIVQVVDTGIDLTHPDLQNMLWVNPFPGPENGYDGDLHGWSHVTNSSNIQDTHGHGSHCSGTIAATNNNGIGVAGIAGGDGTEGSGVRIMTSRVFVGSSGGGGFAEAVVYGADNGAVIANHSWGGGGFSQALRDAILYFIETAGYDAEGNPVGPVQGGLVIFAAGNNGSANPNQPIASNPEVMAIASTNHNDQKSWYSQHGSWITISAPGGETNTVNSQGVLSTVTNGGYAFFQGTSMAAPHAVGVAALVASSFKDDGISGEDIKERLIATSDPIAHLNPSHLMGEGRINAFRALEQDDGVAPADIVNLEIVSTGQTSVTLSWTAPGSSGMEGVAYQYEVRYSKNPINALNFYGAQEAANVPRPAAAGSTEEITISGLNHSTSYYIAVRASDFFGNKSNVSNVVNTTTLGNPNASIEPGFLHAVAEVDGEPVTREFTISNTGNADLNFSFVGVAATELLRNPNIQQNNTSIIPYDESFDRHEADPRTGHPVVLGAGGPDGFGYTWIDSNESGGPIFNWVEISEVGTELTALNNTWDGNTSVSLPFDFPFYGDSHSTARVSVNGWIHFGSFTGSAFTNRQIPSTQDPTNFLAVLWDDLDMRQTGKVYTWHDESNNRFIVQWNAVPKTNNAGSSFTFQAILSATGSVTYQYLSMTGNTSANTIGIENQDGTDGLQVAFNTSYVQNNLAVRFSSAPDWLSLDHVSGSVDAGADMVVTATFYPAGLTAGVYAEELILNTNQLGGGIPGFPVSFQIGAGEGSLTSADSEIEFGDVFVGGSHNHELRLNNTGTGMIEVTEVFIAHGDYSVDAENFSVAPGLSHTLKVSYSPSTTGSSSSILVITTDATTNNIISIPLNGSGVNPPVAGFEIESNNLVLGIDETVETSFSIANSGEATLDYSISLANANILGGILDALTEDVARAQDPQASGLRVFSGFNNGQEKLIGSFDAVLHSDVDPLESNAFGLRAFSFANGSASAGYGIGIEGDIVRANLVSGNFRSVQASHAGTAMDIALDPVSGRAIVLTSGQNQSFVYEMNGNEALNLRKTIDGEYGTIAVNATGDVFLGSANGRIAILPADENAPVQILNQNGISGTELRSLAWDAATGLVFASWTNDAHRFGILNPVSGNLLPIGNGTEAAREWIAFPMNANFWVQIEPSSGSVAPGAPAVDGTISVDPAGMNPSQYDYMMMVFTNDPLQEVISQPLRVVLLGEALAFVQLVHISPDPRAASVDVYIGNNKALSNIPYQAATGFQLLPAEADIQINVVRSGRELSEAFFSKTVHFEREGQYVVVASGVVNPAEFAGDPNVIAFDLHVIEDAHMASDDPESLAFTFFQGVHDIPVLDAATRADGIFAEEIGYGMSSDGYNYLLADTHVFDFYLSGTTQYFANFEQDLSDYAGQAAVVLLTGIDDHRGHPALPNFEMAIVFADGNVLLPRNATSSDNEGITNLPDKFSLAQNYPNPFNPTTQIQYALPEATNVTLEVYNIQGQRVATLVNGTQSAGTHTVTFDAGRLSSGIYLYRIQAGSYTEVRKMMLVK